MQCFIDEIMTGMYLPHKFQLSSNLFRRRNWRLTMSYLSLGALAPYFLKEWFFLIKVVLLVNSFDSKFLIGNDVKNNSSKTFYKNESIKEKSKTVECLGDFWKDIFSLKITTKKERTIQENSKSDEESVSKRKENDQVESRFKKYLREVMHFTDTPKVNLVG